MSPEAANSIKECIMFKPAIIAPGICRNLPCSAGSKEGKGYATRTLEKGTEINLVVGETVIAAVLNDSNSSQALIA